MLHPVLAEFRALGLLALPIVVTQLSQMGMGVMDAVMAGRVSAADLAGVTLGGSFYWPTMLLMSGTVMAVTPSVSQLHGAGRVVETGAVVRQAIWIAVCGGGVLALALGNAEPVYRFVGVDERAIPIAIGYLQAASLGLVPMLVYAALRCLCEGMSWTKPAMFISLSALALKLPLNWLFIYGSPALGVPALGGVGCGWATFVVVTCSLLAMIVVVLCSRIRVSQVFAVFSWPDGQEIGRLLRLGVPIGLALFVEVAFFNVVTLFIGRLGVDVVAAHQVAFNVAGVAFMVPLSLGMAATIRVGFNVGAENPLAARTSARIALCTTLAWGCTMATLMLLLRHRIVGFYSTEAQVLGLAASLLAIGAVFQVFDSAQATIMGALRGYKDTRAPMFIAVAAYWAAGLPFGFAMCFGVDGFGFDGLGVRGFWWGLVLGLAVAALALLARLVRISDRAARSATELGAGQAGLAAEDTGHRLP